MALDFSLPAIHDNADGSWGPSSSALPAQFKEIPYAPYSKSDKISRIADWHDPADLAGGANGTAPNKGPRPQQGQRRREAFGAGESNAFGYVHEEDERSFSVVDSGRALAGKKTGVPSMRGRGRGGARGGSTMSGRGGAGARGRGGFGAGRGGRGGGRFGDFRQPQRTRDSSVTIGQDWQLLDEIEFSRLYKLNLNVEEPKEIKSYGMLQSYEKTFDRITARLEKPLEIVGKARYNVTTSDDPIIASLAEKGTARIFATDSILSVLMCASRSVNSWDIILERRGNNLFLDKRDGGSFDFLTVNENAQDPPADSDDADNINSPSNLSLEATYINANFASQVITASSKAYEPSPNPFYSAEDETEPLASCLYKYRKFDLSTSAVEGEEISIVVRTEVDAYLTKRSQHVTIKALNEYSAKAGAGPTTGAKPLDWRKNLETNKGAIVAGEMKNNSAKLARWAVQSYLAGAEQMKMGYISRANPRDAQRHVIVGVQSYKPLDFARQMNVSLTNGWGIVRTIADLALSRPEGKYVLVKDPNHPTLRMYQVPENAFDADDMTLDGTEA